MTQAERERRIYWERKAAHKCTKCGVPLAPEITTVRCATCQYKHKHPRRAYTPRRPQLYLAVTPDDLELPLYVADTVEELAAWLGVVPYSVTVRLSRCRHGHVATIGKISRRAPRLYSVDIDEEDNKDD